MLSASISKVKSQLGRICLKSKKCVFMSVCVESHSLNVPVLCFIFSLTMVQRNWNMSPNFNCCLSGHVDNYRIIVPTKCTSLLKAQDITICTLCLCILSPYTASRTTQQPLHTPTSRNNSRDMQQHSFNESF
jgi:hypothetical protein